jgi:hypothetical protein
MQKLAQHYANLAMNAGWIDHCRHMVREYEKSPYWKGLGKAVALEIELLKKQESTGR